MIMQGTPFASIVAMARNSISLITDNVHPVLILVSKIPSGSSDPFTTQVTEIDSLAIHQNDALRQTPAHGLVYLVRKRQTGVVLDRIGIGRDHNIALPRLLQHNGAEWLDHHGCQFKKWQPRGRHPTCSGRIVRIAWR